MEGLEAGSRQAAVDAAVQSAAADVTVQLGPALLDALLHGSAYKDYTYESVRVTKCHSVAHFLVFVFVGDGPADLGALEEDPRGVFSH